MEMKHFFKRDPAAVHEKDVKALYSEQERQNILEIIGPQADIAFTSIAKVIGYKLTATRQQRATNETS